MADIRGSMWSSATLISLFLVCRDRVFEIDDLNGCYNTIQELKDKTKAMVIERHTLGHGHEDNSGRGWSLVRHGNHQPRIARRAGLDLSAAAPDEADQRFVVVGFQNGTGRYNLRRQPNNPDARIVVDQGAVWYKCVVGAIHHDSYCIRIVWLSTQIVSPGAILKCDDHESLVCSVRCGCRQVHTCPTSNARMMISMSYKTPSIPGHCCPHAHIPACAARSP